MNITKDFSLAEFNCKDGTEVPSKFIDNVKKLATNLQVIRDEVGAPLSVLSGYRTKKHNEKVGGKDKSQHLEAKAADLTTKALTPKKLAAVIFRLIKEGKIVNGGVGVYPGFVHYDIGATRRW